MLTREELERYGRQIMIGGFGEAGQAKLKQARVFIAGAGGLGSSVSVYLATAGIGIIRIVDWLSSEQIPGGLVLAASHDQPKGLLMGTIINRESDDADLALTTSASIPKHTMFPGAFGLADLARFTW